VAAKPEKNHALLYQPLWEWPVKYWPAVKELNQQSIKKR